MRVIWPLLVLFALGSVIYTVFTGESLGTDTHYNTLGRVLSGVAGIVFAGVCIWSYRVNRSLDKRLAEEKERRSRG